VVAGVEVSGESLKSRGIASAQRQLATLGCQGFRGGFTEALAGCGDNSDTALQSSDHGASL
jgi:hypothetical protein